MMSDIRVSVQWKSSVIFAGEDLECIITFKNVAQADLVRKSPSRSSRHHDQSSGRERWKESLPKYDANRSIGHTRNNSISKPGYPEKNTKAHWLPSSSSSPLGTRHNSSVRLGEGQSTGGTLKDGGHRRSVSIVSLGKDLRDAPTQEQGKISMSGRPARGHARAASLQVLPWRSGGRNQGPTSAPINSRASTLPSPLLRASTSVEDRSPSSNEDVVNHINGGEQGVYMARVSRPSSNTLSSDNRPPSPPAAIQEDGEYTHSPSIESALAPAGTTRNGHKIQIPITRVLSNPSVEGTPRSSVDFYSMSNNSTETLASEYIGHDRARQPLRPTHSRQMSSLNPNKAYKQPEILMMGYGHLTGSFTLDSSLVDHSSFEEVKKKNIVGDLGGGGVVRVGSTKRDSGLFSFSGWGNLGESLGGILGGGELSSIKETKESGNSKSIPILSTPQSILFVDLQLGPGESKSYMYKHRLPRGLPPSHKGRAVKINYNLVVGSQRAGRIARKHNIQHVDIPFRVLPSVNGRGDTLGHDLMSPHIFLKDEACIEIVENQKSQRAFLGASSRGRKQPSSAEDFLQYVETMLERRRQSSGFGLLSPSESGYRSFTPTAEEPKSMKEAIDFAILKSNSASQAKRSTNRYEISRGGDRIAAIMLARPAYRLGETVSVIVAFDEPDLPCYYLHTTLESSETIDPALALRSKASIQRVTRRVHASHSESIIFAKRVVFNPVIPLSSAPEFLTSGICHEWKLHFEFVTSRLKENEEPESAFDLLEELAQDERGNERGTIAAGVQMMPCETFDVTVPLQVYGATAGFDEMREVGDFPI